MAARYPLVYPNPFQQLDHEGLPCATFPFAPEHANGTRRWVGASIRSAVLDPKDLKGDKAIPRAIVGGEMVNGKMVGGRSEFVGRVPDQRTLWTFDLSPQAVLNIKHYKDGVRSGSLFPATPEDAAMLGQPAAEYVEPLAALAAARDRAAFEWRTNYGTDAPLADWPALPAPAASSSPAIAAA